MGSHTYEILLALGVLSPFVTFWILVFGGPKLGKPTSGWVAVAGGMGIPLLLATYVLIGWLGEVASGNAAALTANAFRYHWADMGSVAINVGVKLDSLTIAMYFMVTFIAFWIFFFSVGYMSGHSDEVAGQRKYWRFFAYLSLFGFSMLGLVLSSSLLFLFIFWELVGLCSYLLIGFYFHQRVPQYAQMKAFITNRVGDFGFLIGLMLVFFYLGTLDLDIAAARFAEQYASGTGIFASKFTMFGWSLATIMGVGLFCGAMGKSAQFPLHVWLPDAMAGPTPVSALIHAATMVAAGVYLVARVFRLMTPEALMFVAIIGCLTLTLMALIAIVQVDIKKCLAYSTLSQLGYMIFGLGCGAWIAALFHLITHAFFKAMLFLCSGQVIEGCHHEQDMRKMGGLRKKMPFTCWTFFVGVLAISGAGIAGTSLGLGGFFSKDEILAVAYTRAYEWDDYNKFVAHDDPNHALAIPVSEKRTRLVSGQVHQDSHTLSGEGHSTGHDNSRGLPSSRDFIPSAAQGLHGQDAHAAQGLYGSSLPGIFRNTLPLPKWMFWLAIITAYITPFYMMRAWWLTFMGKPRDEHVYEQAHESRMMFIPLVVLAGGTFVSSYFIFRPLMADAATAATSAAMVMAFDGDVYTPAIKSAHSFLIFGVGFAFLIGFGIAIAIYRNGLGIAEAIKRYPVVGLVHTLLEKKYYIDELYNLVWVKGCLLVASIANFIDTWIVDLTVNLLAGFTERLAAFSGMILDKHGVDGVINGIAKSAQDFAGVIRLPQSGRIRHYVLVTAGVATIVFALLVWFGMDPGVAVTAAAPLKPF